MARDISIHDDDVNVLRRELRFVLQYLERLGHTDSQVVFGWPWGLVYPPDNPWGKITIPLAKVEAEVEKLESALLGRLGGDDVFIRIPPADWEFEFCHHSGIHLRFETPGRIPSDFLKRWTEHGLMPIERDIEPRQA